MGKPKKEKWQEQVEAILREKFPSDEVDQLLAKADKLINLANEVEKPIGDTGMIVTILLNAMAQDLYPKAIAYGGFMLGVAYEKFQNERRT